MCLVRYILELTKSLYSARTALVITETLFKFRSKTYGAHAAYVIGF
jgi:hypothetical protein